MGGAGSLTQIRLRGAEANHVLVLIDGIEVNDPANASEFNFTHLPVADIERIEVLRGPQSALWGSDAIGGVVNIITTRASQGEALFVKGSHGSENSFEGSVNYLAGYDRFNLSLSGNYFDSRGINIANNGSERDGYDNTTLNLKTAGQLYDQLEVGLVARYTNASNEFDPGLPLPVDGFGKTDVEQFYGRSYLKADLFNQRWAHQLETTITDTSNDNADEFFGQSTMAATKEKFSYQTTVRLPETERVPIQQSLVLAAEREQERFRQTGTAFPGFNPNQRQKITNYGSIMEYRARLFGQLTLSASYRHDDNDEFDNQDSYRVGLNYLYPATSTKIYFSHATGNKNPTFTELFGFAPNNFIGNPDLEPERSESWEVGFGQGLLDDTIYLEAAVFIEDLIDEIQTIFVPSFQSSVINSDQRSERDGVELTVFGKLSEMSSLRASYTYVDARQPDMAGNQRTEIRRPRNQWSGQFDYSFFDRKANLNISLDHIGKRRDIDFRSGNRVTLDEYTRVDMALTYQLHKSVKMFVQLRNVLDEEYEDVFGFETEEFSGYAGLEIAL